MRISPIKSFHTGSFLRENKLSEEPSNTSVNPVIDKTVLSYPTFLGIQARGLAKQRGLLMHITSLPAHRSFCGQFCDPQTTKFINWLHSARQTHWIMNPLNALNETLCPYGGLGRFSRNKFIVNLNELTKASYGKLLKEKELPDDITTPDFTFEMLENQKNPRFALAYERFKKLKPTSKIKQEYDEFVKTNGDLWVNEYANFDVIARKHGNYWLNWEKELQTAPEDAKKENISLEDKVYSILSKEDETLSREEFDNQIGLYKFEQFLYEKQFNELIKELDSKNIRLIMDLPIGVDAGGVDTWGKKEMFLLDKNFKPTKVSGCPSEKAYAYTQVWGHALYDYDSPKFWEYQEDSLRQILKTSDLRLDHFVGYVNRAEIPATYTKPDGTVLNGGEIFKPVEEGGMGVGFFENEWITDIFNKRSPKGENMFELFMRIAKEVGKKPEDTYILESFGPLAKTPAYKKFEKKYGKNFMSQRVPIAMGISESDKKLKKLNTAVDSKETLNFAYLTGNHDMASLHEYIDNLMGNGAVKVNKKTQKAFEKFCKEELQLTEEEMQDSDIVFENAMKWHYTKNVKQVQTTLQDALGLYWRPNIPGFWNGMKDKFLLKPSKEALLPYWSKVFPKDFLERDNQNGINPGYKVMAEKFIKMIKELYAVAE